MGEPSWRQNLGQEVEEIRRTLPRNRVLLFESNWKGHGNAVYVEEDNTKDEVEDEGSEEEGTEKDTRVTSEPFLETDQVDDPKVEKFEVNAVINESLITNKLI